MKKHFILFLSLVLLISISACCKEKISSISKVKEEANSKEAETTVSVTKEQTEAFSKIEPQENPTKTEMTVPVTEAPKPKLPSDSSGLLTDTFLIQEVNGTNLIMTRYDLNNGEYKEGKYSCNYGNLCGSYEMKFNAGDVVTVRYKAAIMETYPYQLDIEEIYIARWN